VRERLGDPRVVPSFRCIFLPGTPPSMSPGRSEPSFSRKFGSGMGLLQNPSSSALPTILPSVSSRARISGLIGSPVLRPVRLLVPPDGSDRALPQPQGLLHSGFQRVSLLPRCWISLRQSLPFLSVGLSPTGIAASFAAPDSPVPFALPDPRFPPRLEDGPRTCGTSIRRTSWRSAFDTSPLAYPA
jgi:hypothetical protein